MPELPEVETVKRGLEQILDLPGERLLGVEMSAQKLRFSCNLDDLDQVKGQHLHSVRRRAKYLLFELDRHYLLSHLGMTGSWRIENESKKHDHVRLKLKSNRVLTYHDPRRFGFFEVVNKNDLENHFRFSHLGPEPVDGDEFSAAYLYEKSRGRKTSIKTFIMNQEVVVGVGNIYASEALYMAGIHPKLLAHKLTRKKAEQLVRAIKDVLNEAIFCGGTTISDFKQAGGSSGYFQNFLLVYGRGLEECHFCGTMIQSQAIVGRSSFWCPRCQKL